jgi:tetratricopeptide (TPR) repeat protein
MLTAFKLAPENPVISQSLAWLALSQDQYVEGLDWFRQAALLDPEDPSSIAEIARVLIDLGLLEEGGFWLTRLRDMDPQSCLVGSLAVSFAEQAGDQDRVLELTAKDLERVPAEPGNICYYPIDFYLWNMSKRGQVQEALNYLASLVPELPDYSGVITDNRRTWYWQALSAHLLAEVMEPESFQQLYDQYSQAVFVEYPNSLNSLHLSI